MFEQILEKVFFFLFSQSFSSLQNILERNLNMYCYFYHFISVSAVENVLRHNKALGNGENM